MHLVQDSVEWRPSLFGRSQMSSGVDHLLHNAELLLYEQENADAAEFLESIDTDRPFNSARKQLLLGMACSTNGEVEKARSAWQKIYAEWDLSIYALAQLVIPPKNNRIQK